jgi:hypothetical protein
MGRFRASPRSCGYVFNRCHLHPRSASSLPLCLSKWASGQWNCKLSSRVRCAVTKQSRPCRLTEVHISKAVKMDNIRANLPERATPRSSHLQLQTEAEVRGLQRRCRIVPKRRPRTAGSLSPETEDNRRGTTCEMVPSPIRANTFREALRKTCGAPQLSTSVGGGAIELEQTVRNMTKKIGRRSGGMAP